MDRPVKRGFYRQGGSSIDVRRCPDAATNCSQGAECAESTSGCRGTVEAIAEVNITEISRRLLEVVVPSNGTEPTGCYADLTGTFCLACAPREDRVLVYFAAASTFRRAQCRECRESARNSILLMLGYLALAAASMIFLVACYYVCLSKYCQKQLRDAWANFSPEIKLKILFGFCACHTNTLSNHVPLHTCRS